MYIMIFLPLLLLLNACTVKKPHVNEYILQASLIEKTKDSTCTKKTLKVLSMSSANKLKNTNMRYSVGKYSVDSFSESKWSESPSKAIARKVVINLQKSNIFKMVMSSNSRANSDLLLESNINTFIQHFSKDIKSADAILEIQVSLVNSKTRDILESRTFYETVKVKTMDAEGGVIALSRALTLFLEQQVSWLQKSCK